MRKFTLLVFITILFFPIFLQSQCAPFHPGYISVGQLNGHNYYLSVGDARPTDAQTAAEALGGYLAVIDDEEEDDFILQFIDELTYIGLNDATTESTFEWFNGEPVGYTNIDPCGFCTSNSEDQDYVVKEPWGAGGWSFSNFWNARKYIVEIPCGMSNTDCAFFNDWPNPNVFNNDVADRINETSDGFELIYEGFSSTVGKRRITTWNIDKTGQTISDSDFEIPYPTGMDFGRFSNLGDYFFMHDVDGLNPQLVKVDFSGNIVWTKTYVANTTIPNLNYTASRDAWEDADGILITGHSGVTNGVRQPFLIKTDLDGNEMWQQILSDENSFISLNVLSRSSDGGYYLRLTGGSNSSIIKIDANGNEVWRYDSVTVNNEERNFVGESPDGNSYYFTYADGYFTDDLLLIKLNANDGTFAWERNLGDYFSLTNNSNFGFRLKGAVAAQNGGVMFNFSLFGNITSNSFKKYGLIDPDGNLVWGYDEPLSSKNFQVVQLATSDGGYLLTGAQSNDKKLVWKYTSEGWNAPICGAGNTGGITVLTCPSDISIEAPANTNYSVPVNWAEPTATTDCDLGGLTITQIQGPGSGNNFGPTGGGGQTVVYEITDLCGNTEYCILLINVYPEATQVACPSDITITATSDDGAVVNYDLPSFTTFCNPGSVDILDGLPSGSVFPVGVTEVRLWVFLSGSPAFCQVAEVCVFYVTVLPQGGGGGCPGDFSGFTTLGEFGDSKYYISNDVSRPVDAQAVAEMNGGYLATISSQEENDFIQQNISEMTYIGLNDYDGEGNLEWFNGEAFTFDNINPCGFCNENSDEMDFVIMAPWNGEWSFSNFYNNRKYIMEVPCGNDPGGDECSFTSTFSTLNSVGTVTIAEIEENNANYELVSADLDFTSSNKIFTYQLNKDNGTILGSGMTQINYSQSSPFFTPTYWDRIENTIYAVNKINDDVVLTKYDEQGDIIFTKNIDVTGFDFYGPTSIKVFGDVILITAGSGPTSTLPVIKTDGDGNLIWKKQLDVNVDAGTSGNIYDESAAGGHYLNYYSGGPHMIKIDEDGNVDFVANNGTSDPPSEQRFIVGESGDGSAFYLGRNSNNSFKGFVSRYASPSGNGSGISLGAAFANGSNAFTSRHVAGIPTNDGGYVVFYNYSLGSNPSNPKTYLYERYDSNWDLVWSHEWIPLMTDMFSNGGNFNSLATDDGGFLLGYKSGADEYTVVRMTSEGLFEPDCGGGTSGDLADLTVSNLTNFPSSTETDVVVSFNFDLNNIGMVTATGDYNINMYISTDDVLSSDDMLIGEVPTGDTPVGTIANVPGAIAIPTLLDGNYFLIIVADDFDDIEESNENNNTLTVGFEITSGGGGCPTALAGYTSLGEFDGSAYFLSNDVARAVDAQVSAQALGGNLATIDSQAENDFLFPQIGELAYIGLNDYEIENTLEWFSGDAVNFTNFDICGFCNENSDQMDFVVMHSWNGGWSWSNFYNSRKYIVEIPCGSTLTNPNINNSLVAQVPNQLNFEKIMIEKLHPNPAMDFIFTTIQSPVDKEVELQIFDARGSLMKNVTIHLQKGENVNRVSIADLNGGFYSVFIPNAQGEKSTKRFVKIRN